jgi:hypothetical protein
MPKKPVKKGSPAKPNIKIDKVLKAAGAKSRAPKKEVITGPKPTTVTEQNEQLKLTNDLAQSIAMMWMHNITDQVIFTSLGIPHKTFYRWLKKNYPVTIELDMGGEDKQTITLGFKELKARMQAFFEPGYLLKLERLVDKSEGADDFRTASSNLRWLMGKRLPRKYGREADARIGSDQVEMICNSIFNIIFKHVKDPELLGKIQDDLERLKLEEEQKLDSQMSYDPSEPDENDSQIEVDGD